jgi:hypothetical protein
VRITNGPNNGVEKITMKYFIINTIIFLLYQEGWVVQVYTSVWNALKK